MIEMLFVLSIIVSITLLTIPYYFTHQNNYNFENGAYAITKLVWDESAGRLNIGEREGSFPGMREAVYQTVIVK